MSYDQYTLRHSPDASLPGRACCCFLDCRAASLFCIMRMRTKENTKKRRGKMEEGEEEDDS